MRHFTDEAEAVLEESGFQAGPCRFGRGLFATRQFTVGELILQLRGPSLTLEQVRRKGSAAANALQIGVDNYLDLQEPGRLLNHACSPNVGIWQNRLVQALRVIEPGEELCFDYSTTVSDGWTMPCGCGATHCRGLVAAFQKLPRRLQERYRILGCVQRFMLTEVGS